MKINHLWKVAGIMILVFTLLLAACSPTKSKKNSTDTSANNKDLIVAVTGDPVSLDPQNSTDTISVLVNYQVLDTLVAFNEKSEIIPRLAESWTVSDDEKVWTFKIRKDVKFHDGTPLNAEAVKISFERLFDDQKKLARYPLLGPYVDHVTADSETEVSFHLKNPVGFLLNTLTIANFGVLSPKSISENDSDIAKHPVGTGPYKFREWSPGVELVLDANPDYWDGEPAVQTVTFKPIPENSARVLALETGEVDVIDKVPGPAIKGLQAVQDLTIDSDSSSRILYIGMNTTKAPFDEIKVRQALNYAIDKETLVNNLYDGRVRVATSALAERVFGYSDVGAYPYDLEKAKQLLKEAGVKDGLKFNLIAASNAIHDHQAAEYIQNSLEKLGFDIELRVLELGVYLEELKDSDAIDLFVRSSEVVTNDADYSLRTNLASDSSTNYARYSNPEVDQLLEDGATQSDQDERQKSYTAALKLIKEDAPWIFLYEDTGYVGMRKNIEGISYQPTMLMDLRKVTKK